MPAADVWSKLNLKEHSDIVVLAAPDSFVPVLQQLDGVTVRRKMTGARPVQFALAFVTTQADVDTTAAVLAARAEGDAVVWLAYPKATSKRYKSAIRRDSPWQVLGAAGFESVRMVAIDEDWTAVRFRRAEYIKTMKRDSEWAMSAGGKTKTAATKTAAKRS